MIKKEELPEWILVLKEEFDKKGIDLDSFVK